MKKLEYSLLLATFVTGIVTGLCGGIFIEKYLAEQREKERKFPCGYAVMHQMEYERNHQK